jgi:hypothetical protein
MTGPNPLVAAAVDAPVSPWAGIWPAEDIATIRSGVESGSWIDVSIGAVSAGLDALAFVADPVGSLLQYGVAWLIEHVRPLSEALDWLAGDPAQIAAHAQTWRNVAAALDDEAHELDRTVRWDVDEWRGTAADAYRDRARRQSGALVALSGAADTMAAIVEGAGALIAGVRVLVRDAIAVLVSRLIDYAIEEIFSFGIATPLVVGQVGTLCAAWAGRIGHWLRDLISSLGRLRGLTTRLTEAIDEIKKLLRHQPENPTLDRVQKRGAGPVQYFRLESVRSVAAKYDIDLTGLNISLGDKKIRGVCGRTNPDGTIVLFPHGFQSEEDLARTLVHERFHHDELAAGRSFPREEEFEAWEDRAYAHEEEWWETQPIRPEPRTK